MAYVQPFGQYLTNRLGGPQVPVQAQVPQLQPALGPIMTAPRVVGPQYSVAQMLADASNERPLIAPGLQAAAAQAEQPQADPMLQLAQALSPQAMPNAAGSAGATGEATSTPASSLAPLLDAVKGYFGGTSTGAQASPKPESAGVPAVDPRVANPAAVAPAVTPAAAAESGFLDKLYNAFADIGSSGAQNAPATPEKDVGPETPLAGDTSGIGGFLANLFSSGGATPAPAPAGAPATAPAAKGTPPAVGVPAAAIAAQTPPVTPSPREGIAPIAGAAYAGIPFLTDPTTGRAIEPGQPAPAQQMNALDTAKAEQQTLRSERSTLAGNAVSTALTTALPDLPKNEVSAVKNVFENEDLYKMMIATGAALDSGKSYGEAMMAGSAAFLGSQAARKKEQKTLSAEQAAALQQQFDNQIALYNATKGADKEKAQAKLYEMQTKLAEAGIPLKDIEAKLKNAQIDLAKARTGAANRSNQGGASGGGKSVGGVAGRDLNDKDFAARVSQNRQNMAGNTVLGESANLDDDALAYTNSLLSPANRRYKTPTADVKKEVSALLSDPQLTPEKLQRAQYLYNLYGDVPVEE